MIMRISKLCVNTDSAICSLFLYYKLINIQKIPLGNKVVKRWINSITLILFKMFKLISAEQISREKNLLYIS